MEKIQQFGLTAAAAVEDYVWITIGLFLYAFAWTVFLIPYEIVSGGVTGIAAIIFYATKIPVGVTYVTINVFLLIIALKVLGWKFMARTAYAVGMLTLMLTLIQKMMTQEDGTLYQVLGEGQEFMSLVIGCCFTGSGLAICFLHNGSTGGVDIIAAIINKYRNISLGRALIFIDFLIILSSFPVFHDWRKIVFGLCTMVIENVVLDYIMNARRESVQFFIFSKKWQEIADAIGNNLNNGVTILDGHGWYTGQEMKVLCILAKKRKSLNIFRIINSIDPNAFVAQSSVIGVYGEGFDKIKVPQKPVIQNPMKKSKLTRVH